MKKVTDGKIANKMGINLDKLKKIMYYAGQKVILRLDSPISTEEDNETLIERVEDKKSNNSI